MRRIPLPVCLPAILRASRFAIFFGLPEIIAFTSPKMLADLYNSRLVLLISFMLDSVRSEWLRYIDYII